MKKRDLSERDICTKFITPAVVGAGWDVYSPVREEIGFTKGRIIVRGNLVKREDALVAVRSGYKVLWGEVLRDSG